MGGELRTRVKGKFVEDLIICLYRITVGNAAIKKAEQNARIALKYSHRGYILDTGNIILEGSAQDLLQNEEIKKAYLGK